jgi:hypothetical protein
MLRLPIVEREYIVPAARAARATASSPSWWKSRDMPVGAQKKGSAIRWPRTSTLVSSVLTSTSVRGISIHRSKAPVLSRRVHSSSAAPSM